MRRGFAAERLSMHETTTLTGRDRRPCEPHTVFPQERRCEATLPAVKHEPGVPCHRTLNMCHRTLLTVSAPYQPMFLATPS